jgi:hypothetical protein
VPPRLWAWLLECQRLLRRTVPHRSRRSPLMLHTLSRVLRRLASGLGRYKAGSGGDAPCAGGSAADG